MADPAAARAVDASESVDARTGSGHAPAIGLIAAVTAVVLHPAITGFLNRPMVGGHDSSIFAWAWWNLEQSVREGRNPFRSDRLFYPVGVDLSVTVMAPAVGVLSWPIRLLLGPDAQMNAVQLGATFGAGISLYFLALRFTRRRSLAALAGGAFAITPYMFAHLGEHLNLIHTWVVPLALLLVLRLVDAPSSRRMAAVGASLGGAALIEPQLAVIATVGALVIAVRRWDGPGPSWRQVGLSVVAAAVAAAPVGVPMAVGLLGGSSSAPWESDQLHVFSSRIYSWLLPAPWHPWFGAVTNSGDLYTPMEGVAGPGLAIVVLAVVGRRFVTSTSRAGWVALAWTSFVLSLGPFLAFGEGRTEIPLPYYPFRLVPFMDTMRVPGRFAILGVLALCILAVQAADALLDRLPPRRRVVWLTIVPLLLVVELLPGSMVTMDGGAPEPYHAIAADAGEGAVLEIPVQWLTGSGGVGHLERNLSVFQAWATVHGKPYVGGSVSRYPDDSVDALTAIPLYRQVLALQGDGESREPVRFGERDLAAAGIGYVVYHRDVPVPEALAYLESLALPVLADDGTVIVWRVPAI